MKTPPVAMGANLHVDRAIPNFGIQEYSGYLEQTHEMFPHAFEQQGGYLTSGEAARRQSAPMPCWRSWRRTSS